MVNTSHFVSRSQFLSIFIAGASSNRADPSPLEPSLQPWTLRSALSHHHSPHNLRHQGVNVLKSHEIHLKTTKNQHKNKHKNIGSVCLIIKTQDVSSLFCMYDLDSILSNQSFCLSGFLCWHQHYII